MMQKESENNPYHKLKVAIVLPSAVQCLKVVNNVFCPNCIIVNPLDLIGEHDAYESFVNHGAA